MAAEEVVTVYKSEVEGHIKGLNEIIEAERQAVKAKKEGEATDKQAAVTATQAAQKRKEAIEQEQTTLLKLQEAKKKAFTVREIDDYNRKISESEKNIRTLEGSTQKASSTLQNSFKQLGGAIVAAFAVQNVIAFGKESVRMFAESEKAQLQLLAALGGQEDMQKRLIKQADQLQSKFGIDNDTIVSQQAFLAIQGRTEEQIKKTINAAIALSAVTKEDLPSSIQKLDATFEGNIGRLGKLDEGFKKLTPTELANGGAIDLVNEKYTQFAEKGAQSASTQLEIQQRRVDDLKKSLGRELAPEMVNLETVSLNLAEAFFKWAGGASSVALAIGEIAGNNTFSAKFKALQEQFKTGLESKSIVDLIKRSRELGELNKTLTGEAKNRGLAERQAILDEIILRGKANTEVKKQIETLETLQAKLESLKETQKTIADPLGKGKTQNDSLIKQIADTQAKIDRITGESAKKLAEKRAEDAKKTAQDIANAQKEADDIAQKALKDNLSIQLSELESAKQKELQAEERSVQEKLLIDIKYLEKKRDIFKDDPVQVAAINAEIEALNTKLGEQIVADRLETQEGVDKQNKDFAERQIETEEEKQRRIREIQQAAFDLEKELSDFVLQLAVQNSNERIAILEDEKETKLAAIDEEISALEEQRNKRLIGERDFETQSASLKQKRVDEEKKINLRINEEKRKQAKIAKDIAIFEATLNFSKALIMALSSVPFPHNLVAELITASVAGVQLAAIISAPIPKFEYGTKRKGSSGLSIVGERGMELINLPDESQVLPNSKFNKHKPFINAMFDDQLDRFINDNYILPALINQRRQYEEAKEKSFAGNLAASLILNSKSGLDEYGMARALNKVNPRLAREIGKEVARNLPGNSYSAYMD